MFGQEFQGNPASQADIFRLVHGTHPSAADLANQAIVRNDLSDQYPLGFRIFHSNDRTQEPITFARNGLDVVRVVGVIAQGIAKLADGDSQTAVILDKGIVLPNAAVEILMGHRLSRIFQ
jgi:hypothetical protein